MSNASRAKGTKWEVELLDVLRDLHGEHVERAPLKGTSDCGDFTGVPYLVEAKNTKVPKFLEWTRQCRRKAKEHRDSSSWILVWKGDRRTLLDPEPLVLMPLDLYSEMQGKLNALEDASFLFDEIVTSSPKGPAFTQTPAHDWGSYHIPLEQHPVL